VSHSLHCVCEVVVSPEPATVCRSKQLFVTDIDVAMLKLEPVVVIGLYFEQFKATAIKASLLSVDLVKALPC
jgi:hypothetical protein